MEEKTLEQQMLEETLTTSSTEEDLFSGLFFMINKNTSTFTLKGEVFDQLSEAQVMALQKESPQCQFYFTTYPLALAIAAQLFNKRYYFEEESFYNLSDPSDSWWFEGPSSDLLPAKIKIFFRKRHLINERIIKIGPIGDAAIFQKMIDEFGLLFFSALSPSLNYKLEDSSVIFESKTDFVFLKMLEKIFLLGIFPFEIDDFKGMLHFDQRAEQFYLYFKELAAIRRFWKKIIFPLMATDHLLGPIHSPVH